ncbi:MAG TPA: acyl-CoA thioesterase II [Candidatus Limnocylindrales bacterium]|nr:acyl-CoA thioesterase II [Candidatus Limnocylindrales bacterium]
MPHPLLDEVVSLLDVEELEVNIFRGYSPEEDRPRVFGGQVAAQSLMSAARTVPADRRVHSLHSYFLRPGDMHAPILFLVDRIRDGKSFTTRRVVAVQHGEAIFNMAASFQVAEQGVEHSLEMPAAPDPESLPTQAQRLAAFDRKLPRRAIEPRAIDMRWCDPPGWKPNKGEEGRAMVWMRADGRLPADSLLHTCVLVYASDYTLTETVMRPHGVHWSDHGVMAASLDHAMWFHRDFAVDDWWLYVEDSPAASGARGLARGVIFDRAGRLCCSVAQEVLLRVPPAS